GLNIRPSKKGAGSVDHGIKWLQDINEIIIDPRRTPNIFREFRGYEIEQDKMGNFKGMFPDKDNHTIDSTRYALEMVSKPRKQSSAW
ncbi:PBSX family phage terminase large subunit, partial [Lactococcus lactis]|nr:PBSX family phage terminase large subunit [Lactococcus lactis]